MRRTASQLQTAGLIGLMFMCACSLLTSLDGLAGEPPLTPEAGSQGDAPAADSTAPTDAGAVEAADATDAAAPFCSSITTPFAFCSDFDGIDPLEGWGSTSNVGAGSLFEPSTARFQSPSRSGRATLGPAGVLRGARVTRSLVAAGHVRLSYSIFIEARPTTSEYEVNILTFSAKGSRYEFYLAVSADGANYTEQTYGPDAAASANAQIPLSVLLATGKWSRVVLDLDVAGSKTVVVTIDGVEAARKAILYALPGELTVRAGITYANGATDRGTVSIDDYLVELL